LINQTTSVAIRPRHKKWKPKSTKAIAWHSAAHPWPLGGGAIGETLGVIGGELGGAGGGALGGGEPAAAPLTSAAVAGPALGALELGGIWYGLDPGVDWTT